MNKLAIIVTTINPPVLVDFLESIERQNDKNFHVFIVDITDSLTSPSVNSSFVTFIKATNDGYAASLNTGLKRALIENYTKFCAINDDTFFQEDFVDSSLKALDVNPFSVIGGKIYYAEGYEHHKKRYKKEDLGNVIWFAGGKFDWDHVLSKHVGVDEVDKGQFDQKKEVDFITGALMLFDKRVLDKVGFWDESYFLYFEDADFCVRAKKKGLKLVYEPSIKIWHKVSQSTGGSGSSTQVKYQTKNRLRFGLKYAPLKTKAHLLKNFILDRFKSK